MLNDRYWIMCTAVRHGYFLRMSGRGGRNRTGACTNHPPRYRVRASTAGVPTAPHPERESLQFVVALT